MRSGLHIRQPAEVLYESSTTRVFRGGPQFEVVCKEPRGDRAEERLRHEKDMLARLAGVKGVVQLAAGNYRKHIIALQNGGSRTLAAALQSGPCDIGLALSLGAQLAGTLAEVHRRGLIHRDVNPANVMLGESGDLLLIDFDLACLAGPRPAAAQEGHVVGTLAYLAPEQSGRTGHEVDHRADLYGLGVTLYEMVVGRLPFESRETLQLIHDHLVREPVPPVLLDKRVPERLSDIIVRLLAKEPRQRYQSAEGLQHDLQRLLDDPDRTHLDTFALGERDFPLNLTPPPQLVGREREFAVLREALVQAMGTQRRTVLVEGAAGVGKSVLVGRLRPVVAAAGGWFVHGKFDQYQKDRAAQGPLTHAMRTLGRLLLAQPAADLAMYRQRILSSLHSNTGLITRWLPEFALLLGTHDESSDADPQQAGMQLLQAVSELVAAIASPVRPLVLLLDDLQWAGGPVLRVFAHLMNDPAIRGLLLVGAYRLDEPDASDVLLPTIAQWREQQPAVTHIALSNLPESDAAELIARMLRLDAGPAQQLAHAVCAVTSGNPFDTVETVNALRREALLTLDADGWHWDEAQVRGFVGNGDVARLVAARIARIPPRSRDLLAFMSCLGSAMQGSLLCAAAGIDEAELRAHLRAPLEEALVFADSNGGDIGMRFQHDRVQQAMLDTMTDAQRCHRQLEMARRLSQHGVFETEAAEQYLACLNVLDDPQEQRRAVKLFQRLSQTLVGTGRHLLAENYLAAASTLLALAGPQPAASDPEEDNALRASIDLMRHATLYSLGRLEESDPFFEALRMRLLDPLMLVEPTCLQIRSLDMRGRAGDAIGLGLGLLERLGLSIPAAFQIEDANERLDALADWIASEKRLSPSSRAGIADARLLAIARLLGRMARPAFFSSDARTLVWLMLESQRLWAEEGPCADLVASLGQLSVLAISRRQDYRCAFDIARRAMDVGAAMGWEPHTSEARGMFAGTASHWFEPLETTFRHAKRAYEGMQAAGDLSHACYVHRAMVFSLLDIGPTIDAANAEIEAGLVLCRRTGNAHAAGLHLCDRQLLRALRGETRGWRSFDDDEFDEGQFLARMGGFAQVEVTYSSRRALCALLLGDLDTLRQHAERAKALLDIIPGYYPAMHVHVAIALARAWELQARATTTPATEETPTDTALLLAELEASRAWLAARAADQPHNFLPMLRLVEAEQAWALGEAWRAAGAFDAALQEAEGRQRPWHRALIAERAGLFHHARGLKRAGQALLVEARDQYEAWGATAKVLRMEKLHALARNPSPRLVASASLVVPPGKTSSTLTPDALDLMGVLRASQALSSETSLEALAARVTEVLAALTGASNALVLTLNKDQWWLLAPAPDKASMPLAEAIDGGLLPASLFAYAERTGEPLVVEDAVTDDRFARDPYFVGVPVCSCLAVPLASQGGSRAMLLLENRQGRAAFSARRLDAVTLVAGQLAVSLANVQLYHSLEERVQERTRELKETQAELVATARRAGKAEIASNVLHNVGNVLNSITVSAGVIRGAIRNSRAGGLSRVAKMLTEFESDLPRFLSEPGKSPALIKYLNELVVTIGQEQTEALHNIERLVSSVEHISYIVATQQSHTGPSSVLEVAQPEQLAEEALRLSAEALNRYGVAVERRYSPTPSAPLDKPRTLQILVNLIGNAAQAMEATPHAARRLTLSTGLLRDDQGERLCFAVQDAGEGIAAEHMKRLFSHGFTTRKDGHGFGLHSSALAALEMGARVMAHSDGPGRGARFTLELPL